MKSTQMQLYRGGELVLQSRDAASDDNDEDHAIQRARPHVVRLRVAPRGDRRHNYVRRWRFRGVDELRRQQDGEPLPSPDVNVINETC